VAGIFTENDWRDIREICYRAAQWLRKIPTVSSDNQETRSKTANVGFNGPRAQENKGCDSLRVIGCQPTEVSCCTSREVGLVDPEVAKYLQDTFLYR
jgi:hypothetical protein